MTDSLPTSAGWYSDPPSCGTRYWDGTNWTGDRRPPRRRSFAAAAHHREWGLALALGGLVLPLLGFLTFLFPEYSLPSLLSDRPDTLLEKIAAAAHPKSPTRGFVEALGTFWLAAVWGALLVATGVYLLRGRGPTTQAVQQRLAAERAAERADQRAAVSKAVIAGGLALWLAMSRERPEETVQALQDLEDLRQSGVISDDEFQAEKDRLLGNL